MRLIDADGLKLAVSDFWKSWNGSLPELLKLIDNAPTIDAAPVVHGEWVGGTCGLCGYIDVAAYIGRKPNYCPNCGARMDGDQHD